MCGHQTVVQHVNCAARRSARFGGQRQRQRRRQRRRKLHRKQTVRDRDTGGNCGRCENVHDATTFLCGCRCCCSERTHVEAVRAAGSLTRSLVFARGETFSSGLAIEQRSAVDVVRCGAISGTVIVVQMCVCCSLWELWKWEWKHTKWIITLDIARRGHSCNVAHDMHNALQCNG